MIVAFQPVLMMTQAKRIYILMIEVNKFFFLFCVAVFSKRNRKHVLRVSVKQLDYELEISITHRNREQII